MMTDWEIEALANVLMHKHGLIEKGWIFDWDRARTRFGATHYRIKRITLSRILAPHQEDDEIRDTLLHEIAHALVGPGAGHGPIWQAKAREIGAKPNRVGAATAAQPIPKYTGRCPNGHTVSRERLTERANRVSCGRCRSVFDPQFKYVWTQNR